MSVVWLIYVLMLHGISCTNLQVQDSLWWSTESNGSLDSLYPDSNIMEEEVPQRYAIAVNGLRVKRRTNTLCIPTTRFAVARMNMGRELFNYGTLTIMKQEGCGNDNVTITVNNLAPAMYDVHIGDKITCYDNIEDSKKVAEFHLIQRTFGTFTVPSNLTSMTSLKDKRIALVKMPVIKGKEIYPVACGKFEIVI